jgi:hypothetical protein
MKQFNAEEFDTVRRVSVHKWQPVVQTRPQQFQTAGVAALRRGFEKCENADLGRKMPI